MKILGARDNEQGQGFISFILILALLVCVLLRFAFLINPELRAALLSLWYSIQSLI